MRERGKKKKEKIKIQSCNPVPRQVDPCSSGIFFPATDKGAFITVLFLCCLEGEGEGEGDTVPVKRALKRRDTPDQERARGSSMGTGFEFIRDGD